VRALIVAALAIAACTAPPSPPDSGPLDSGPQVQQFCVGSFCSAGGTWRVAYAGTASNPVCRPVDDQLQLTSDGGTVCMLRASDGGSDGGCGLQFVIVWAQAGDGGGLQGVDTWDVFIPDAGHMYGSWATHVTGVTSCDAVWSIHGQR
jgi:hypothetical protein